MKNIYLMRHGETLFNTMNVNQGQCDSPLTAKGIQQTEQAGQWLKDHHIVFDDVCSSPLLRACDTTEIVTDKPYHRVKGLKEIFLGTKEAGSNDDNPVYPYGDYFVKYGGEDLDAFTNRIYDTVKNIAETSKGNTILIVTHGMAVRRFLSVIDKSKDYGFIGNCGIVHLTYDHDSFTLKEVINPCQ